MFRQEIHRLENDEREAERDLKRLHHDLARASISSLSQQPTFGRQSTILSRSTTPYFSIVLDSGAIVETTPISSRKVLHTRPISIQVDQTNDDRLPLLDPKRRSKSFSSRKSPWTLKEVHLKSKEIPPHLRKHFNSINRQKREIEQKLKEFLH